MGKQRGRKNGTVNTAYSDAVRLNIDTFNDYLDRFRRIALSIFVWENLPDTMNARYLEQCLFETGKAALLWYKDGEKELGFINTKVNSNGGLNLYGLPARLNCWSYGNIRTTRRIYLGMGDPGKIDEHCIYVMNNWEGIPTLPTLELYAYRMTVAQRTADINILRQRMPYVLTTDQDQVLTVKNMIRMIEDGEPSIIGDKNSLTADQLKSISTNAPFIADKVMEYKRDIWNEFLTFLGVNNLADEKKERMIVSETQSNNEVINLNLQAMLAPRQEAARLFNLKYGFTGDKEIKVKVRSDLTNFVKQNESAVLGDNYNERIDNE